MVNIDKFAKTEDERNRLAPLFACYEQLADLCYLNRTHGICIQVGRNCAECKMGQNLDAVRKAFGFERETSMHNVAAQRISDAYWDKFNSDCERAEKGAIREHNTAIV